MLTLEGLENWYIQTVKVKHAFAGTTPPDPIPLPDVTNVDGMLEGIAGETEEAFVAAAEYAGKLHGATEAYKIQLPAKVYRWYGLNTVGGKTIVYNQQVDDTSFTLPTTVGASCTMTDHVISIIGTSSQNFNIYFVDDYPAKAGHKYICALSSRKTDSNGRIRVYNKTSSTNLVNITGTTTGYKDFSPSADCMIRYYFQCAAADKVLDLDIIPRLFDLTVMFGAGNEPTLAEFETMFPFSEYYAYNAGELMNIGVTDIISKDANNDPIETISIPSAITSLTGYGMSCPGETNYIDFKNKKFVQNVGSRSYASGDESDATVITDGTTTHYKLTTPVETSITIADDIKYADGGTITFENQYGYGIPVPVNVGYIG